MCAGADAGPCAEVGPVEGSEVGVLFLVSGFLGPLGILVRDLVRLVPEEGEDIGLSERA